MIINEINELFKQCDNILKDQREGICERDELRQNCITSMRELKAILLQRNKLREIVLRSHREQEETVKEMKETVVNNEKYKKKLTYLNETLNAMVEEYNRVMSERDFVHSDFDKLFDNLTLVSYNNMSLRNELKSGNDEIKRLKSFIELLKCEISSALHDRDNALQKCSDYQNKLKEITAKNELQREFESQIDFDFNKERDNLKNLRKQIASLDKLILCQKGRNCRKVDQANKEIERLRQLLNDYRTKLNDVLEHADISMKHRDLALVEQGKVMKECESIRVLCDNLRKQRDDVINKLAYALKDRDDVMKQNCFTTEELKNFEYKIYINFNLFYSKLMYLICRKRVEAPLEIDAHLQSVAASNRSEDLALDMQDWDTEVLNIYIVSMTEIF